MMKSSSASGKRILIAGAGIGGLTAALALDRAGFDVTVFESTDSIQPLGVGVHLQPEAVRVLHGLGLESVLAAAGIPITEFIQFSRKGEVVCREPRAGACTIHRGRLQMLLLHEARIRLGDGAIQLGHHLAGFESNDDSVRAIFRNCRTGQPASIENGAALIGADGIHSAARETFYPAEREPEFSGWLLWRGITEAQPFLSGRTMVEVGDEHQRFVAFPICPETALRDRSLINWIAELNVGPEGALSKRDWNRKADRRVFAPEFQGWTFDWMDVPGLIAGAAEVYEFPMVDRDPVPQWSFGRVTLLGDAAHPMYPTGSNGASQAILDAEALTEALAGEADVVAALGIYEKLRLTATARIVRNNRQALVPAW